MPISYEIDGEHALVHTRCRDGVTLGEVIEHFSALRDDPRTPPRFDVLLDQREMTTVPESGQLRAVAGQAEALGGRERLGACAIVASADVLFGMSRMFEVYAEPFFAATRVFRELAAAEAWLASLRAPRPR
jgi:hypothetical protein